MSVFVAVSQLCNKDIYFNTEEIQQPCPNHVNSQAGNLRPRQGKYGQSVLFSVLQFPDHPALILRLTQWLEGKQTAQSQWRHHHSFKSSVETGRGENLNQHKMAKGIVEKNPRFLRRRIKIWKVYLSGCVAGAGTVGCNSLDFLGWYLEIYNS